MSENMNGVSAGNAADKTYANTKYKDTFSGIYSKKKRVCWSCIMHYLMIV